MDISNLEFTAEVPPEFCCSLSLDIMMDPVILSGDGFSYSRAEITQWLRTPKGDAKTGVIRSPQTGEALDPALGQTVLIENKNLRSQIVTWVETHSRKKTTP